MVALEMHGSGKYAMLVASLLEVAPGGAFPRLTSHRALTPHLETTVMRRSSIIATLALIAIACSGGREVPASSGGTSSASAGASTAAVSTTAKADSANRGSIPDSVTRAPSADSAVIAGVSWTLVQLDGTAIENARGGKAPTLQINADGGALRASGMAGCNRYSGPVTQDGNSLRFGPLAATKMACPALQLESKYLAALNAARSFHATSHQLDLIDGNRVLARFSAP
ncbi:MAG: META domain-containing protein [Gemmatimonadaceae bacterium]